MQLQINGRTFTVDYTYHPEDMTAETAVVAHRVIDDAGLDVEDLAAFELLAIMRAVQAEARAGAY